MSEPPYVDKNFWKHKSLTILVPAFNELENLRILIPKIIVSLESLGLNSNFKILVIDDGSKDGTFEFLSSVQKTDKRLDSIRFRTNQGKSLALGAGFVASNTDFLITMDADLQDQPSDIVKFLHQLEQGVELVCGRRAKRKDTLFRRLGSKIYNYFVKKFGNLDVSDSNCGFKGYEKTVYSNLMIYGHFHRFIPFIANNLGFSISEVDVKNSARMHGESKYRSVRYEGLFDLLSLMFLKQHGLTPLHFFGKIAMFLIFPCGLFLFLLTLSQIAYLLGLGDSFMIADRPLIVVLTSGILIGGLFMATGFVCDFLLSHLVKERYLNLINVLIKERNIQKK